MLQYFLTMPSLALPFTTPTNVGQVITYLLYSLLVSIHRFYTDVGKVHV